MYTQPTKGKQTIGEYYSNQVQSWMDIPKTTDNGGETYE